MAFCGGYTTQALLCNVHRKQVGWCAPSRENGGEKPCWARHLMTLKHHDALARSRGHMLCAENAVDGVL